MVAVIQPLYSLVEKSWGRPGDIWVYRTVKIFLNIFYPVYCRIFQRPLSPKVATKTIVSLTSFPPRIERLWMVIETLLRQSVRPEKLILWLSQEQFQSVSILPKNLQRLQKIGLEIRLCDELLSHKKYFYSMLEYPEYNVITVDDDTFYPENLVETLLECSNKNPGTVCCYLAHEITFEAGSIGNYEDWICGMKTKILGPSNALVPIGCEGIFYPSGALDVQCFDRQEIKELCPYADDLWLKAMSVLKNIPVARVRQKSFPFANMVYNFFGLKASLSKLNNDMNMNNIQLAAIIAEYPDLIAHLKKMD